MGQVMVIQDSYVILHVMLQSGNKYHSLQQMHLIMDRAFHWFLLTSSSFFHLVWKSYWEAGRSWVFVAGGSDNRGAENLRAEGTPRYSRQIFSSNLYKSQGPPDRPWGSPDPRPAKPLLGSIKVFEKAELGG
jgi:hypothetical protein